MEIEFYGATERVTGSCHILHVNGKSILLDCGFIQGDERARELNSEELPVAMPQIDAVVLSHAHLDHSGRLPLLFERGYNGPVFMQNATADLLEILLKDAARIQAEDVKYANKKRKRKGLDPLEPLYREHSVNACLKSVKPFSYRQKFKVADGVEVRFQDAGHILGSSIVELWLTEGSEQRKVVFSGDLGQYDTPILHDPAVIETADVVIMESTYGNRLHREKSETIKEIGEIIQQAGADNGNVMIPAFALGRSQELLYTLGDHFKEWHLDDWQIFLNSPMAIEASHVYWQYPHLYDDAATKLRKDINEMPILNNLHLTTSVEESKAIHKIHHHALIIAGSGMMTAGRIMHHLKHNIGRPECHLIVAGYQGRGTLGRDLVEGADEIWIHRKAYKVRAKIHTVGGLSAHGDQADLLRWLNGFSTVPLVCIVHGEDKSERALQAKIKQEKGWNARIVSAGERINLLQTS